MADEYAVRQLELPKELLQELGVMSDVMELQDINARIARYGELYKKAYKVFNLGDWGD